MRMRIALFALVVTAAVIYVADPAVAHTPTITTRCGALEVRLTRYERGTTVTVTIGGVTRADTFAGDFTRTYTGTGAYRVVVDNQGSTYDGVWTGNLTSCATPTTSTTTTRPPSTTTTVKVIELIPPITMPPTVLAFTGPGRAETLAIIGLCLLGTGGSLYVAARRRTA